MIGHIYLIRNLVNGKGYIGKTEKSISVRFRAHKSSAKSGNNAALYRAMRKHGIANFSVIEVIQCDPSLLNDAERHYIKFFGTRSTIGHGYNETDGGDGISGWVHSDEAKAKVGNANRGRSPSLETRMKLSIVGKGKKRPPRSAEYRAKQSIAQSGKIGHMKGKHHSAETKRKLSIANLGKTHSKETKEKLSALWKGKKQSPEHIAKRMMRYAK